MDLSIFVLLTQDGVTNGAVYALLALALVLVFTVTRVIFVPSGEFVAYGTLTLAGLAARQGAGDDRPRRRDGRRRGRDGGVCRGARRELADGSRDGSPRGPASRSRWLLSPVGSRARSCRSGRRSSSR
jgi:hypothetical protein